MNWDPEPIATRALARAEGKKPQPSPFWSEFQAKIDEHVTEFEAAQVQPEQPQRRSFVRRVRAWFGGAS